MIPLAKYLFDGINSEQGTVRVLALKTKNICYQIILGEAGEDVLWGLKEIDESSEGKKVRCPRQEKERKAIVLNCQNAQSAVVCSSVRYFKSISKRQS